MKRKNYDMSVIDTFRKQGGISLLKRYAKSGALFTAIAEFMLLGKKDTALELLRLSADYKTKRHLEKKYKKVLEAFDNGYDSKLIHNHSNKVWVCWFQGMENAPLLVKKCYESLKRNLHDKEIILITLDNINDYVSFPDYIFEKWKKGIITHTHMTDLLRLELLIKYGGTWIDSTVLCTRDIEDIPKYYFESDLFFHQSLKPGKNGQSTVLSSWYISASSNNRILMATRSLCYEYWKKNNDMVDYFLLHIFFQMALEYYKEEWHAVAPVSNSTPHILLLRIFDRYDANMLECIKGQTPFHKLSYKFSDEQKELEDTYYKYLISE